MSKKRVHEIAKEHGLSSKELLERLQAAGVAAKAAASSVEEADALRVLADNGAAATRNRHSHEAGAGGRTTGKRSTRRRPRLRPRLHKALPPIKPPRPTAPSPAKSPASAAPTQAAARWCHCENPDAAAGHSRRRACTSHARLAHRRAHTGKQQRRRAPARRDRLSSFTPPAGRPGQPACAPSPARAQAQRHLRRDDRPDRHDRDGGHR